MSILRATIFMLLVWGLFLPMTYANPTDTSYADLLNSGKYQLKCTIEKKSLHGDIGERVLSEITLIKDGNGIDLVDILSNNIHESKPFLHEVYLVENGKCYDDKKSSKQKESVLEIKLSGKSRGFYEIPEGYINPLTGRPVEGFNKWNERFLQKKEDVLKLLGPLYRKPGKSNKMKYDCVSKGTTQLEGKTFYYEDYNVNNGNDGKLRYFYEGNTLVRIFMIISNNDDAGFIMGIKRNVGSFTDMKIIKFSGIIDHLFIDSLR